MRKYTVNIGLDRNDGRPVPPDEAFDVVLLGSRLLGRCTWVESDTEPTLVAELSYDNHGWARRCIHQIAVTLGQDCIAVVDDQGEGELIGPNAAAWGDFNPEFFLQLDGSRLAQPATV